MTFPNFIRLVENVIAVQETCQSSTVLTAETPNEDVLSESTAASSVVLLRLKIV